jgi:hypothetical protein
MVSTESDCKQFFWGVSHHRQDIYADGTRGKEERRTWMSRGSDLQLSVETETGWFSARKGDRNFPSNICVIGDLTKSLAVRGPPIEAISAGNSSSSASKYRERNSSASCCWPSYTQVSNRRPLRRTGTYEQGFELPLLHHCIIQVRWFERINEVIVFLLFMGPRCSACGRLGLRLRRMRFLLDHEFLENPHCGIYQWCCTTPSLGNPCAALSLQIAQFPKQVPERRGIYK